MSLEKELLGLCLDVYEAVLQREAHLPAADRAKLARAAAERVVDSAAPGAAGWIEKRRPPHDQLTERREAEKVKRARERARPFVDQILREANIEGDVSEELLMQSTIPWVVVWRDQLCWLLSRKAALKNRQIAAVIGMSPGSASEAIHRHEKRCVSVERKEAIGGA